MTALNGGIVESRKQLTWMGLCRIGIVMTLMTIYVFDFLKIDAPKTTSTTVVGGVLAGVAGVGIVEQEDDTGLDLWGVAIRLFIAGLVLFLVDPGGFFGGIGLLMLILGLSGISVEMVLNRPSGERPTVINETDN